MLPSAGCAGSGFLYLSCKRLLLSIVQAVCGVKGTEVYSLEVCVFGIHYEKV